MEKTAVDYLIEILEAPCRGIPTFVIEKAKEIHKQQLLDAWKQGNNEGYLNTLITAEDYYNDTYGK
jgi:hypothetical protein